MHYLDIIQSLHVGNHSMNFIKEIDKKYWEVWYYNIRLYNDNIQMIKGVYYDCSHLSGFCIGLSCQLRICLLKFEYLTFFLKFSYGLKLTTMTWGSTQGIFAGLKVGQSLSDYSEEKVYIYLNFEWLKLKFQYIPLS